MTTSTRAPGLRSAWLVSVMLVLAAVEVVVLLLPAGGYNIVMSGVGVALLLLPPTVCWVAVRRTGFRRPPLVLAAAAVTAYTAGNLAYAALGRNAQDVPFPSLADVGYLLFYPLMLAALVLLVGRQRGHLRGSVWLDTVLGSLGAASVLAVVLSPVLEVSPGGSAPLTTSLSVASPVSDLLLLSAVAGIAATHGLDLGRRWTLLVLGLLVFAATDVGYAIQTVDQTYELGSPLDAGWVVGLVLVTVWVDQASRAPLPVGHRPGVGHRALAVSAAATAAAVGVLLYGTREHVSGIAVVLSGATLLAAAARTQLAFRRLVQLADLRRETRTDDLTGLANRRALYADVPARLAAGDQPAALLLLDLDRFKEVNDSLGHQAGDRLLVQVGTRLADELRSEDMLARLGGDEFAILLGDTGQDEAVSVAIRLRAALAAPFTLEGISLQTDVSIGIALFPEQGRDLSDLLRRADIAMYHAKASRAGHRVFKATDDTRGDARLRMLEELRVALSHDQLVVYYQPKVDLESGAVRGVEALVRWEHPTRGLLYPDAFIELVDESGLMHDMTRRVLDHALGQAALWEASGTPLTVAVNLSARSLMDVELPDTIARMIVAHRVAPSALVLELTERTLMVDHARASASLARLRDMGIRIAVDDFGTGYSSLAYLRDLPIDELKLDRSFIFSMADDARAAALVESTIALGHSLDLRMVAEGVENRAAYLELARYGCDEAQGYYLSRPVPAPELERWLEERTSPDALRETLGH